MRKINAIAREIETVWNKVAPEARPYLDAMHCLEAPGDYYGADSATGIIAYFLGNATGWRGEDARRIKAELKKIIV